MHTKKKWKKEHKTKMKFSSNGNERITFFNKKNSPFFFGLVLSWIEAKLLKASHRVKVYT